MKDTLRFIMGAVVILWHGWIAPVWGESEFAPLLCTPINCANEDGLKKCISQYNHNEKELFSLKKDCIAAAEKQEIDIDGLMENYFPDHVQPKNVDPSDDASPPDDEKRKLMAQDINQKNAQEKIRRTAACNVYMCSDREGLKKCMQEMIKQKQTLEKLDPDCRRASAGPLFKIAKKPEELWDQLSHESQKLPPESTEKK